MAVAVLERPMMKAVLATADMRMEHLVIVTIFTTDMQESASLNKIYGSYFDDLPVYPSRTAVGSSALSKNARVELTAIAEE
jgi:2-iminobutanoate/2-iminopropanoate deaminase